MIKLQRDTYTMSIPLYFIVKNNVKIVNSSYYNSKFTKKNEKVFPL